MNDTSISSIFSIRYKPLGEQHSYKFLLWKRNLRFLTSGDPVILCPPFKVLIDCTNGFRGE